MRGQRVVRVSAAAAILAAVVGCAGTRVTATQPLAMGISRYARLVFWTESAVGEDVSHEVSSLEQQVLERVKRLRVFPSVLLGEEPVPSEDMLLVRATIMDIRKVSGAERFFLGIFAGQASITAQVVLIDGATGETLGSYTVTGESGGLGMSRGTGQAVENTAQGIADLIARNSGNR